MPTSSPFGIVTYTMTQRVLVAIDDSGPATAALEYALHRFNAADITVLHVMNTVEADNVLQRVLPTECEKQRDAAEQTAETVLRDAQSHADAAGIEVTTVAVTGKPVRQILAFAEENGIDQIVMGTHGRSGLDRLLFGSLSHLVMEQSPVPVTRLPEPITSESADVPLGETQTQDQSEPLAATMGEPSRSPSPRWCSFCAVTLYTQLEFCPGCLEVTISTGTSNWRGSR